jgi:hypothetical protein
MRAISELLRVLIASTLMLSFVKCASAENYSDIWWNPLESGWGVTIADHETNIFGVLYAYRADGRPVWFTIPGGTFSQGRRIFQGDVYATTGPAYTSAAFDPSLVTATKVGNAAFDFTPPGLAPGIVLFTYTINGVSKTKQLQRQAFGNGAASWGTDRTDLWFNPAESGWGLALAQHGNNIFGVWYAYDTDGQPLWFVLPGGTFSGSSSFSGNLYRTTGPYFGNASFDPSAVRVTLAGTVTLSFAGLPSVSMLPTKASTACPGLSATFVATVDNTGYPRLTCPQPFGNLSPGRAPPSPLAITTLALPDATAGTFYSQPAAAASGGAPPYHFQLDTLANGAPPIGMSIDLNGNLTGTPSSSYTTARSFTFGVCVADIVAASKCSVASVTVVPPMPVANGSLSWTLGDQCNNGDEIDYRFFDTVNNMQWPADRTLVYYMVYGQSFKTTVSCVPGALVCYGAASGNGSRTWGIGLSGTGGCTSCCGRCDGSSYSVNLTCPGVGGGTSYYANWSCGSSSQCASVMGGSAGSRGPFCSVSDCQRWGNQFIPTGYSCSTSATYTPAPGGSSCQTYP